MINKLKKDLKNSILAKKSLLPLENKIEEVVLKIYKKISAGGKVLCGNRGSAADAKHLVAEFFVRLRPKVKRKPIAEIALAMNRSTITACENDYSFDKIYSRNLDALGSSKDVLITISNFRNSNNILKK
jgi:D-sedoheptulose 7-phosphate isomerase